MSIEVKDVTVGYFKDVPVLHGVSIYAREKMVTGLIGPNGAGKSTALKAIYGFLKPTQGKIVYNGKDITAYKTHKLLAMGISYVPQQTSNFPYLTVEDNLKLGAWIYRRNKSLIKERLRRIYDRYPNLEKKKKMASTYLSGGEQKMVEIAKALIVDPKVILIDEPTAGLAPKFHHDIYTQLNQLAKQGKTVILVDQKVRELIKLANYIYVLTLGKNRVDGPKEKFETEATLRKVIADWISVKLH